jgi:N-acetylneuraminic acid mutarotase
MPREAQAGPNEWTWVSGSNLPNQPGVYGTLGTPAAANVPGWRTGAASWTDKSGNLWLFGGEGLSANFAGTLNDLWEFNPSTGEWAWMGGSDTTYQPGVYGTQGVPAGTNIPGAREQASCWTDSSGNFWLFGGNGYDENGNGGLLNDLWEFNPTTKQWTWVAGSRFNSEVGVYGTLGTPAALNAPGARSDAASWVDKSGHFWIFAGDGYDAQNIAPEGVLNDLWEFDPASGEWTWMGGNSTVPNEGWVPGVYGTLGTPAAGNLPGSRSNTVTWTDASGNLWLFGGLGYGISTSIYEGFLNDLWEFNPATNEWAWMGGSDSVPGSDKTQPGVYGTLGTPAAGNVPGGRADAVSWTDASGNLWFFGGLADSGPDRLFYNDLWVYIPSTNEWAWMGGSDQPSQLGFEVYGTLGVYGTEGVPAAGNMPGSRTLASSWVDKSGNFWLFGGNYLNSSGVYTDLNDLWRYQPSAPGGGGAPIASLTPNPVAFPNQELKTTSAAATVTLSNTGTAALTGIVISLKGTNPSDFATTTGADACGTSLAAGSSCDIYVTFTPAAAASYAATLSVADNASGSPQTAALTGTGTSPPSVVNIDINEAVHIADAPAAAQSVVIKIAEAVHIADAPKLASALAIHIAEAVHIADAPAAVLNAPLELNIAEIIHTTDTPVLAPTAALNIAEIIHTTDAPVLAPTAALNIAEIIHTADVPVPVPTLDLNIGEVKTSTAPNSGPFSTQTALSSSTDPSLAGQSVTFTATVASASASAGTPAGTVQFSINGTAAGAPASLNANGRATYTTAALADGSSSITAAYNGNSTFLSSNADSFTQLVLDFGFLTGSSQSATIFPGQSASFKFAIAPKGTFSGTITFSASGLPPGATASFNPATLTPGSTANDVVMTVQTAPFSAAAQPVSPQLTKSPLLLGLLLPLFGIRRARREFKRRMLFLMALLSFGIAIAISGCGGDGFFNQPPHAYAITVKATSGALQHTTTVNLTVQ